MWIYVQTACVLNLQTINNVGRSVEYYYDPTSDYMTQGSTWLVEVLEMHACMHAELTYQQLHFPFCQFNPILFMLHRSLYHELKKSGTHSSQMTRKEGKAFLPSADGCFCLFYSFLPAVCLHQGRFALNTLLSHWSWQDFPGLLLMPGGDAYTPLYLHAELRARGKSVFLNGGLL